MSARSRRLNGSLGSSWGNANYSSDDRDSVRSVGDSASEVDLQSSDNEIYEQPSVATPLPPRTRRNRPSESAPLSSSQITPVKPRAVVDSVRPPRLSPSFPQASAPPKELRATREKEHFEPSFIMPVMNRSPGPVDAPSPQQPQFRRRTMRQSMSRKDSVGSVKGHTSRKAARQPKVLEKEEVSPWHYANLVWENVVWPLINHFLDILSYALRHFIKPILGVALGMGILIFGAQLLGGMLRSSISNALITPVCMIPGSSYIVPACATGSTTNDNQQANFEELINVQGRFEDIVEASKDTSALPSTIKNSELAIRDLRTLVRYSRLPSRRELDNEFEYFIQTANEASVDLSRYNSHIGAAMDRVIATNTWTMNVLHGIEETEARVGAIGRVFNAMTGAFVAPPLTLQQRVFDQYLLHVSRNKEEITRLIETAQALLQVLNNLDGRLGTIFEIATNDDHTITRSQEELLSSLWTKLGGNRSDVKANAQSLNLLKNINAYRKKAVMHVSETLLKLQEIQAELENLREGVAAPEVLGYRSGIPLSYHLDLIEKGVESLRVSRGESMRVEGENYRRLMRNGEQAARELPAPTVTVNVK